MADEYSNVCPRNLRRRRILHKRPSGWCLRRNAYRVHRLQSLGRRITMPPGQSRHPCHCNLRAYPILQTYNPSGHHRTPHRCTVRREDILLGEFRWTGKVAFYLTTLTVDTNADSHRVELHPGDYVTISASRFPFANVMPEGRRSEDWVNSISRTLQWNSRQKQKALQTWSKQEASDGPAQ